MDCHPAVKKEYSLRQDTCTYCESLYLFHSSFIPTVQIDMFPVFMVIEISFLVVTNILITIQYLAFGCSVKTEQKLLSVDQKGVHRRRISTPDVSKRRSLSFAHRQSEMLTASPIRMTIQRLKKENERKRMEFQCRFLLAYYNMQSDTHRPLPIIIH